jgi:Glycosyltransferase family 87
MGTGSPGGLVAHAAVGRRRDFSWSRLRRRAALGLSLAFLIGLVASYAMLLHSGAAGPKKTDFVPYFSAAHLVGSGQGGSIYSFHQLGQFESTLVRPLRVKDGVMPYLYPPYFALVLAPLAALPYTTAFLIWMLVNVLLLGLSLAALQRYAGLHGGSAALFWAASLSFLPVLVGLAQGQTSVVLLALFTGVFLAARADRNAAAGFLLACALIKPTYVLPVLAVLVIHRRWQALATFGVTAVALLALPVLFLGTSINAGYGNTLLQASGWRKQIGGFEAQWNHSFAGFAQLLFPGFVASTVAALLCLVAVGVFLWFGVRSAGLEGSFALAVIVGLLVSPHVLVHDLSLLIIPVAVALRVRPSWDRALPWAVAIGYGVVLLGLALVTVIPVQWSVIAMCGLGMWFVSRLGVPESGELGVPA